MREITHKIEQTEFGSYAKIAIDGEFMQTSFNNDQYMFNTLDKLHGITTAKEAMAELLIAEVNTECDFRGQNQLNKHEQQQILDIIDQVFLNKLEG